MSLFPQDWLEYEWKNVSGNAVAELVNDIGWRVWRVSIDVDSTADGGLETQVVFGGPYDVPFFSVYVSAGKSVVVEPRGMFPALITVAGGLGFRVNAELIRRSQII